MRRITVSILIFAIILSLTACASGGKTPDAPGENQIMDATGKIIDIPEDPSSATIASVYAVTVPPIVALGLSDRVLAVNTKSRFWTDADEDLGAALLGGV